MKKIIYVMVLTTLIVLVGCDYCEEYSYNLFRLSSDGNTYTNNYKPCLRCERINETYFECGNACDEEGFYVQDIATEGYLKDYMVTGCR